LLLHGSSVDAAESQRVRAVETDVAQLDRFGYLFPELLGQASLGQDEAKLRQALSAMGRRKGPMHEFEPSGKALDSTTPAGYAFLAQFITHDITFDPNSHLNGDLVQVRNHRTPALDLDSIYGGGPMVRPEFYRKDHTELFLIDRARMANGCLFDDVPRNSEGVALMGDPRNDTNVIISQLHLAFLLLHNRMVEHAISIIGAATNNVFEMARTMTTWYFHKVLLDDFLPKLLPESVWDRLMTVGPTYYSVDEHYMPLEFSGAVMRYGHSQIRNWYQVNSTPSGERVELFELAGNREPDGYVEWRYLFELMANVKPQMARRIDTKLPDVTTRIPDKNRERPLAQRNLLRGVTYDLPSGQAIAQRMVIDGLMDEADVLAVDVELTSRGIKHTPLWFYVLQESQVFGQGDRLGPVGGTILGEVLLALMQRWPGSPANGMRFEWSSDEPMDMGKFLLMAGALV